MQFTADTWDGLASGAITLTFRAWKRPLAKVGAHHKVGDVVLEIDRVERVPVRSITDADARRTGHASREAVLWLLARRDDGLDDDTLVYRVEFHRVGSFRALTGAERAHPAGAELDEITRRLDRLDGTSSHGPWTRATLRIIAQQPRVVSTELAQQLGRDRPTFKIDVRKLERLGLTSSHDVGYELTPKGAAVLQHLDGRPRP